MVCRVSGKRRLTISRLALSCIILYLSIFLLSSFLLERSRRQQIIPIHLIDRLLYHDYKIDAHDNCNNVYHNTDSQYVKLFGTFITLEECQTACISVKCDSYTYHNDSRKCYGFINNALWIPYYQNQTNIYCGRIIYRCTSDIDCSLNGVCNTQTGNCICDTAWNGYKCGNLSLLPATKGSGYNYTDDAVHTSSWGGSLQYNKETNVYDMFVAEMQGHCGIDSWLMNSQIMHAQSVQGEYNSKYTRISRLLVPFAHSPGIIYASNTDEYVLIYVHNKTDHNILPCTTCTDGTTPRSCNRHNNMTEITSIRWIDNLSGADDINKWSDALDLEVFGHGDSNFAAQINDNGNLYGMVRKSAYQIYLITATDWKDNTSYVMHSDMNDGLGLFPYLPQKYGAADMYPYKDCKGRWHALFHNRSPGGEQTLCGGHAFSKDGTNWIYGGVAFTNTVQYDDGEMFVFLRRERPHLAFDLKDQCTPVMLSSSVTYYHDASFTLVQTVKH